MIHESISLKYEPASEPLHIAVIQVFGFQVSGMGVWLRVSGSGARETLDSSFRDPDFG